MLSAHVEIEHVTSHLGESLSQEGSLSPKLRWRASEMVGWINVLAPQRGGMT